MTASTSSPTPTTSPGLPIVHEKGSVTVTLTSNVKGELTNLQIRVEGSGFRMDAQKEDEDRWSVKATHVRGHMNFQRVWENIPASVAGPEGSPRIAVAIVVADVLDMTGSIGTPSTGYNARAQELHDAFARLQRSYGGDMAVTALRMVVAAEGYRVAPDLGFISRLGGDCHAYHEVAGGIFDRLLGNGQAPALPDVLGACMAWKALQAEPGNIAKA